MTSHYEPLSAEAHGHLYWDRTENLALAKQQLIIPVVMAELANIAREFLLVFPNREGALPHALLGLEPGQCAYWNQMENWKAAYIPAFLRIYPFKLAVLEDGKAALMLDATSPALSTAQGEPLFVNQKRGPIVEALVQNLVAMHHDEKRTKTAVACLEKHGLLIEHSITNANGKHLTGLRMVDPEQFAKLSSDALLELQQTGGLELYYAQLHSQVNLRLGLIASQAQKPTTDGGELGLGFLNDSGVISFGPH